MWSLGSWKKDEEWEKSRRPIEGAAKVEALAPACLLSIEKREEAGSS